MRDNQNKAIFKNMEFREILISYIALVLNKRYKNPKELKEAIIKTHELGGIDTLTMLETIKALNLEQVSLKKYDTKELNTLIDGLIDKAYITQEDYFILTALEVLKDHLTIKEREQALKIRNIAIDLMGIDTLKGILEEIEQL